jgi:hypothetical protein
MQTRDHRPWYLRVVAPVLVTVLAGAAGFWLGRQTQPPLPAPAWVPEWLRPAAAPLAAEQRPVRLLPPPATDLSVLRGPTASNVIADECSYFSRVPSRSDHWPWTEHPRRGFYRTIDSLGLRRAALLPAARPWPLVVLTGDSHLDGICSDEEVASAVAERRLRAAAATRGAVVLNAATGFFTFANYLGVAARYLRLAPEAFVVVVYGGNDFGAAVPLERELLGEEELGRSPEYWARLQAAEGLSLAGRSGAPSLWQALNQVASFADRPELAEQSLQLAVEYLTAIGELCAAQGTALLVAYLPPPLDVAPELVAPLYAPLVATLGLDVDDLRGTDRLADGLLERLGAAGVETLDLRPLLRAAQAPLFWVADEHLNVAGQRLVGEALAEALGRRWTDGAPRPAVESGATAQPRGW